MSSAFLLDWLNTCLKDITHKDFNGCKTIKDVEINKLIEPIMIMSNTQRLVMTLEDGSGKMRRVSGIVKLESTQEHGSEFVKKYSLMDREIEMYSNTFKIFEKIMLENGDKEEKLWPDYYIINDSKLLIQDLKPLGYRPVPTEDLLDVKHSLILMKSLGKYHSLTMIMMEKGLLDISKFGLSVTQQKIPFLINFYKVGIWNIADAAKEWGPEWSTVPDRLRKLAEDVGDRLANLCESVNNGVWKVLNHGDANIRNYLYSYQADSDVPVHLKFIDFQNCHYGSPVQDLSMTIYGSLHPQTRDDHFNALIEAYTTSLRETCHQYNYRGTVPSQQQVAEELFKFRYNSAIISITFLPYLISPNSFDIEKEFDVYFGKTGNLNTTIDISVYQEEKLKNLLQLQLRGCLKDKII